MKAGKVTLGMLVAGLLLVTLAFVAPQPKSGAPSVAVEARAAQPEVEGRLLIYVNNVLKYSGKVHSFLKPATPMLALGLFPTSSFQSAGVTFYGEDPSTWWHGITGTQTAALFYGGYAAWDSVWGMYWSIAPLVLVYDANGNKWAEISLSTTPSIFYNSTGVLLSVSGSVTPSLTQPTTVSMLRFVRPTGASTGTAAAYYAIRLMEDTLPSPVTVNPGDSLTIVYQFYFKADQIFTANWASLFFAWLYNVPGAKINVTATDGTTDYVDPYASSSSSAASNVPVGCYIVVGNGQASFSRTAYKVVSEVARAEPSVQVYGGGVSLSYAFTFSQDTTVTELAVYVKLSDGKYVMLLYYVLPQPAVAKAGVPFTVTFRINLPYADRV
jgi:hypothetical protein